MIRGRSPLAVVCALAALLGLPAAATAQEDTTKPINTTPLPPAGWLTGDYVVLLSVTDETAFDRMEWMAGGGELQLPDDDGNATVSGEGVHTLETRAVDAAGNESDWRADTVRIDLTDPVDDTAPGTTAWRSAPATVTVAATDAPSGVDRVEWRLDGGGVQQGPNLSTVALAGDGEHTLLTRAVDRAGRTSAWRTHTIRVDTVLPVLETAAPAGWQTSPLPVSVTGSDAHSGVAQVRYTIDGGLQQTGLPPTIATITGDGEHTLHTQVVDYAGNATGWKAHAIRIDTTAPDNQTATPPTTWLPGDYPVTVKGADSVSGVFEVEWRVNGGAISRGPSGLDVTLTESRDNTFQTRVRDVAGNYSGWRTDQVMIDKVAPTDTTATLPAVVGTNPYRVPVTGGDLHSGVSAVDGGSTTGRSRRAPPAARPRSSARASTPSGRGSSTTSAATPAGGRRRSGSRSPAT